MGGGSVRFIVEFASIVPATIIVTASRYFCVRDSIMNDLSLNLVCEFFALVNFTRLMRSDCIKWTFLSSKYISYYTMPDRSVGLILLVVSPGKGPLRVLAYIDFRRR